MNIGMLWYDNDPKTDLFAKVNRAAAYYQKKYGQVPDLCYIHPSMGVAGLTSTGKVEIRTDRSVLPNHLWIGIQEQAIK